MAINIVGMAQPKSFVLVLTGPSPPDRHKIRTQYIHWLQHGVFTNGTDESPQNRQCSPEIFLASNRLLRTITPHVVVVDTAPSNAIGGHH